MVKNHKLARAISEANLSELVRQLDYKAEWYGRELIKIDRYFPSSKHCSNCGHVVEKLPLSIREWNCPKCGTHHDRDINASINILRMGTPVGVSVSAVADMKSVSESYRSKRQLLCKRQDASGQTPRRPKMASGRLRRALQSNE